MVLITKLHYFLLTNQTKLEANCMVLITKLTLFSADEANQKRGGWSPERFIWFAASAERKFIFKVEKSMNPEVLGCFSSFSNFSDFSWFWDALAINFHSLASFPARGRFQIDRALNFKLIQIFVFIWCSCADPGTTIKLSKNSNPDPALRQNPTPICRTGRKLH